MLVLTRMVCVSQHRFHSGGAWVGIQNEVQGQSYLCGQMVVFFVVLFVSAIESFGVYCV